MSRFGRTTVLAAVLCSAMASFAGNSKDLNLEAGTMSLGGTMHGSAGNAMVSYTHSDLRGGAGQTSAWNVGADLMFGYFFIDDFMVDFRLQGNFPLGRAASANDASMFGVGIGMEYVFMTGSSVRPYIGTGVGTNWTFGTANATMWGLSADADLGLLVGLNENVALDFGVGANFMFPLNSGANAPIGFNLDMGYVGVKGFF